MPKGRLPNPEPDEERDHDKPCTCERKIDPEDPTLVFRSANILKGSQPRRERLTQEIFSEKTPPKSGPDTDPIAYIPLIMPNH